VKGAAVGGTLAGPMLPTASEVHRLSYDDVMRMVEAGVLRENERVELIDGVLVDMIRPSPEHSAAVAWLTGHFVRASADWEVRVQDLLIVPGGFLMPDLMVIDSQPRGQHPSTAHLVIEVSVSTHARDHWKAEKYAGAGVREYWLIDVPGRTLTVHRRPAETSYEEIITYREGTPVESLIGAPPVDLREPLGPAE
jgi:Uma2 family endonuclease